MAETTLSTLAEQIEQLHAQAQRAAAQQVNYWLTVRNWLIGWHIAEYEQGGSDRADYGERVLPALARQLRGVKGLAVQRLYDCRAFYRQYPILLQTASGELHRAGLLSAARLPAPGASEQPGGPGALPGIAPQLLLTRLSFSHFLELLALDRPLQRAFYEVQAVNNSWSVRELKRAIESALYERTGLSTDKAAVLAGHAGAHPLAVADVMKNPYVLEFLGLDERARYSESDLEAAIIAHLQTFLVELGRGFCFEARQKRITFDNEHYFIDLVFYHRILKCHVLVDLKLGAFSHADAGQMNVYLNYYREQEMTAGDNPPVGLILCAQKNDTLVRYATTGMAEQLFVSKYQTNLPSEEELQQLVREEQERLGNR
ncbi:PDDEXK nuclease domain-containing protein [Hymenobacter terricola]|uniref:PDDEXK nuclease domain-containing protein n=1 Tax=Hymenobacter terricola TaxID=2819236 RepID=UPI001B307C0F|nr:PDDEXK nuclease domain-containing protein [Hymenobacter terricola]